MRDTTQSYLSYKKVLEIKNLHSCFDFFYYVCWIGAQIISKLARKVLGIKNLHSYKESKSLLQFLYIYIYIYIKWNWKNKLVVDYLFIFWVCSWTAKQQKSPTERLSSQLVFLKVKYQSPLLKLMGGKKKGKKED